MNETLKFSLELSFLLFEWVSFYFETKNVVKCWNLYIKAKKRWCYGNFSSGSRAGESIIGDQSIKIHTTNVINKNFLRQWQFECHSHVTAATYARTYQLLQRLIIWKCTAFAYFLYLIFYFSTHNSMLWEFLSNRFKSKSMSMTSILEVW